MPIKVRVGQTEAIKILASAGGGSVSAQTATNVIGGIASVTQLNVSGISTLGNVEAGIITASSFVGPLTGDVTGTADLALGLFGTPNIDVGAINASSLNITGITTLSANGGITTTGGDLYVGGNLFVNEDITLDEINAKNLNITGVSTFTKSVGISSNLQVTGISTFVGIATFKDDVFFKENVSIGGTLTYEDVTNVDAVGLITARSGIEFGLAGVGGTIRANGDTTLAGIVTAGSGLRVTTGGLIVTTGISTLNDTTQSTSTITGALRVAGGVGIAKSVYIGGLLTAGLIDGGEF